MIPAVSGYVDVQAEMEDIIHAEHDGLRGVSSTHAIVLQIDNPNIPSIDLVDGSPASCRRQPRPASQHGLWWSLTSRSTAAAAAMYLLAVPAGEAPTNSAATRRRASRPPSACLPCAMRCPRAGAPPCCSLSGSRRARTRSPEPCRWYRTAGWRR